jgi:hypothetical protein
MKMFIEIEIQNEQLVKSSKFCSECAQIRTTWLKSHIILWDKAMRWTAVLAFLTQRPCAVIGDRFELSWSPVRLR